MKTLKVGDRVSVYGSFAPKDGGSLHRLNGAKGTALAVDSGGWAEVKLDRSLDERYIPNPHTIDEVHPIQCRKLKAKKHTVFYIPILPIHYPITFPDSESLLSWLRTPTPDFCDAVWVFKEVKK